MIFVHPQLQFHLDVRDDSHSLSLPPFPDNTRFPTRTIFLDSMIVTILDPPSGRVSSRFGMSLRSWIPYFFTYTLRNSPRVLPTGDLEPQARKIGPTLTTSHKVNLSPGREHVLRRKEILESLGASDDLFPLKVKSSYRLRRKCGEVRRPLPASSRKSCTALVSFI